MSEPVVAAVIVTLSCRYTMAKRDNDSVYFEKVPSLTSLPVIQGAIVAKPQPFDWHDPNVSGQDIFHKLVPLVTVDSCVDDMRTMSMVSP